MFRRSLSALLILTQIVAPASALSLSDGQFYFRFKSGVQEQVIPDDSTSKDITAFYIAGLGEDFSEILPMKAEWENDDWQIVKGSLPSGISFNSSTLTFEGRPTNIGSQVTVELSGFNARGEEVATATATFSVYDMPDTVVSVNYYHRTNQYASDALKLPTGVTIDGDPVLISAAPPGVTYNARYFDGTPTKAGVYPVLAFGYDYTRTKPIIAFKGKYTVEDAPVFARVNDDLRKLTESDYWGCRTGSECAVWYEGSTPKVQRALKSASDVKYSVEVQGGGSLPGSLQFRNGPSNLQKFGRTYTAYDQATIRYRAVDVDGIPGYSNWFKIGSLGHTELCKPTSSVSNIEIRGTVNSPLAYSIPDSKDQSVKQYAITGGQLPSGIQFNSSTGSFSGAPTQRGTTDGVFVEISYPSSQGSAPVICGPYRFSIAPTALSLTYSGLKGHYRVGESLDVLIAPKGTTIAPYSIEMNPDNVLPAGVNFDPATNKLSGVVDVHGYFSASFKMTNGDGLTYNVGLSFEGHDPISISDVQPRAAIKRFETSSQLLSFSYDAKTIIGDASISLIGQDLPLGFNFNKGDLTISGGTCVPVGPYGPFQVQVRDSTGQSDSTNDFYIDVTERDDLVAGSTADSLKFSVNLNDIGQRAFSVARPPLAASCFPTLRYTLIPSSLPNGLSFNPSTGLISGMPTVKSSTPGYTLKIDELSPYNFSKTSAPFSIEVSDPPPIQDMKLAGLVGTVGATALESSDPIPVLRSIRNSLVGFEQSVTFSGIEPNVPGMTFNPTTGTLKGVPSVEFDGDVTISYIDGAGRSGKLLLPLKVYPFPTLKSSELDYALPRLSDASSYDIKVEPANNGFYGGVSYSLAPASDALPLGLSLSDGAILGRTSSQKDRNYKIVVRGTSPVNASIYVDHEIQLHVVEETPMNFDLKPDSTLIWKIDEATGTVTSREKFTSVKPTGSYVTPLSYSLLNAPSWLTIDANSQLGGIPQALGERSFTVQVLDAEQHKGTDDVTIKVTLDGVASMSPGSNQSITVREGETFETVQQVVTNVVRPFEFVAPGKPSSITLDQASGAFKGRLNTSGTVNWSLDVMDSDQRKTVNPTSISVKVVPPVKLDAPKTVVNGTQYDPTRPISITFAAATNIMDKATYAVIGTVPGTVVYKYYDGGVPTGLATYYLEDGTVVRQSANETAEEVEYNRLPPDHMIFDTLALTLKGIPSSYGSFQIGLAVSDSYEDKGYIVDPTDPTRSLNNFDDSPMVTLSVAKATDLQVANSANSEALHQYTSQPTMSSTVRHDAYGRGVSWSLIAGTLPTNVNGTKESQRLSYNGYPTVQGTWSDIRWKATDIAGRDVTTDAVSLSVGPRQSLQLVASSTMPRGMVVFEGGANLTISPKYAAYGLALGKTKWTVTGVDKLPPGVTHTVNDNSVRFTGTSTVIGTYAGITVTGVDSLGATASIAVSFRVISSSDPIELNVSSIRTKVDYPIIMEPPFAASTLSTDNTYGTIQFSSDNLPTIPGISLDPVSGYIAGTVSSAQNLNFDLVVTDDTNRITRKPVLVSVLPNLRLIMPSQVPAEQGKAISAPVATDYVLGAVAYEKGAGNWPVGFIVNPVTGEITSSYLNPATGKTTANVIAASGTYSGLTVVGKDSFGLFTDQQQSNSFSIIVQPSTAAPDIANQSKTILGTEGVAIVDWAPKAQSGWAAGVVEKGKSSNAWNYGGTVYTASHDLSDYGLIFDQSTGMITGTPTKPFIIRDFVITVTSQRGDTDSTSPFWIGVAPSKPLAIAPTQRVTYDPRVFKDFRSDELDVQNYIGDLTFVKASSTRLDFDTDTGSYYKLGSQQLSDYPSSTYNLYTSRVTDEFGRVVTHQISVKFTAAIKVTAAAATINIDKDYPASTPVVTPVVTNVLGNASWSVTGLPAGLTFDPLTGKITGNAPSSTVAAGAYNVTYTAQDEFDGSEGSYVGTITVVAAKPDISDQSKTILGTQGQAISWAPKATSGWAAAVIEKGKGATAWNYPRTVFEANYDLEEYGLTFNTSTGAINGTPTKPFVIRDFVIKVIAPSGANDSTTPFWLGVAPKDAMAIPAGFKTTFGVRKGGVLNTTDLQWDNAVGNLTHLKTSGYVGFGVSATTGRVNAVTATSGWPESTYPVGIRVTDEFNRTSNATITVTVVSPLTVTGPNNAVMFDVQNDNLFTPMATGVLGTPSYVVTGLPQGLTYDAATGRIHGMLDTSKYSYNQSEWPITIRLTDSEDGSSATASGSLKLQQGGYRYFRLFDAGSYTYWGCAYLDVYNEFGQQINTLSTTPFGSTRQGLNKVWAQSRQNDGCQVAREANVGHWVSWDFKSLQNVTKLVVRYDNTWNAGNSVIRAPQFQGSNDNVTWSTLWTSSSTGGAMTKTYARP
jgi:hypothetical protein